MTRSVTPSFHRSTGQPSGTRHLLFTGKGGVGKTTIAAATAVALADEGQRVLVVSTDPASNLDDVFATPIGQEPTPIAGVAGLFAINIDPEAAAAAYRTRTLAPYRGAVPPAELANMEEQLSGQCTVEVAAFDQFSLLLGSPDATEAFDRIIFDTAPTGHTLRLLSLPAAWSTYLETTPAAASCLGPLGSLEGKRDLYEDTVTVLRDPRQTTVVLVSRADRTSLREAARAAAELAGLGVVQPAPRHQRSAPSTARRGPGRRGVRRPPARRSGRDALAAHRPGQRGSAARGQRPHRHRCPSCPRRRPGGTRPDRMPEALDVPDIDGIDDLIDELDHCRARRRDGDGQGWGR